jgi:hypothetical protein
VDGGDVLASAAQYDLTAILDQRPVCVCGIGSIFSEQAPRRTGHAEELVERLLGQSTRNGAVMALLFSEGSQEQLQLNGFDVVSITDVELAVTESSRRGAPMTLIRGGEERDLAAIAAMVLGAIGTAWVALCVLGGRQCAHQKRLHASTAIVARQPRLDDR